MASISFKSASEFPLSKIADLLTRSFEGYLVPIHITESVLLTIMRRDSIDLSASRILIKEEEPIGVALIARRGWTSRLAAMGIVSHTRNSGIGTTAMEQLIQEARGRADKEMMLEVIEQNIAGVKLYQKIGFKTIRRLVGYKLERPQVESSDELEEVDIREMARMISAYGVKDLPWQLSAETIAHHTPPSRAFRLNNSYCLISDSDVEHVAISSVLVNAASSEADEGQRLMRAVFFRFANKVWHVSPIFPQEMCTVFDQIGMKREEISQWQMSLIL